METKDWIELIDTFQNKNFVKYFFWHACFSWIWWIVALIIISIFSIRLINFIECHKVYSCILPILRIILFLYKRYIHIPKSNKSKIWIIICIDFDSYNWFNLLNKFIWDLKQNLDESFMIIELPKRFYTENFFNEVNEENFGEIIKVSQKCNSHYWIFGKVEMEQDWEMKYFINMRWIVFHNPINTETKNELIHDFTNIFPSETMFPESYFRSWYKFLWKHSAIVAKYIIWVAQLVSGNPFSAWNIHKDLHLQLLSVKKEQNIESKFNDIYMQNLWQKLKSIQYHELNLITKYYYYKKDWINWIKYLEIWNELANYYWFINADLYFQNAIFEVKVNHNYDKAKSLIKLSRNYWNKIWFLFSTVFLEIMRSNYSLVRNRISGILWKTINKQYEVTANEILWFFDDSENFTTANDEQKWAILYWKILLKYKILWDLPNSYTLLTKYIDDLNKLNIKIKPYWTENPFKLLKEIETQMDIV